MHPVPPLFFIFFLCWRKIIFSVIFLQKLDGNSRNSVCSFHWCYLIIRMGDNCCGICCTEDDMWLHSVLCLITYCMQPPPSPPKNLKPKPKPNPDCELKEPAYFGSGLNIILTEPARTRIFFKYLTSSEWDPSNWCLSAGFPIDLCKTAIWERKYYWARRRNVGDKFQLLDVSQNNSARRKWSNFTFYILEALPKAEPTKIPPSFLEVSNCDSKGTVIKLWFRKTWLFSIFYSHVLSRNRTSVRKVVVHTDLVFLLRM